MKAQHADKLESMSEYNQALECYKDAVAILIPLIEGWCYPCSVYET